jgi:hypothetical protein
MDIGGRKPVLKEKLMRPALFTCVLCLIGLAGCGGFPQVDAAHSALGSGEAPQLVPVEGLIAQAVPGRTSAAARDALFARAAGLRLRAVAMRGPVHSPDTRARLAAAQAAYPALLGQR